MAVYKIGIRGCQHLGYGASGMRLNKETRWNQRVSDGHVAHQLTMQSMIEHGVAGVVDGGDIFHFNKPLPRDVAVANQVDDLRAEAAIWGLTNSGNHDVGGGSDISAAGIVHRPHLGMVATFPDPTRSGGVGPYPGLYEVHTSATNPHLPDGLALHVISHYGLSRFLADNGIRIDPQPLDGHVNLLFAHGTFAADDRLYQCINPHGEERAIPPEWAERGWEAMLLSHFHTLGAIPGYGEGDRGQVWYTGSALRRGFVDEPGTRGWLEVAVHDTGKVTVTPVPLWQRPQHDLPKIDATNLTVSDLDDLITANLVTVAMADAETGRLTGDPGAIVRQRVTGSTHAQRQGLSALRGRYAQLAADAAHWTGVVYDRNVDERAQGVDRDRRDAADVTTRVTDYEADLRSRYPAISHRLGVPTQLAAPVLDTAAAWAGELSPSTR